MTFAIAGVMYILWRKLAAARKANVTLIPHAHLAEPLAFTMSAALAGGGQMIVHTKMLAELIELSTSGDLALADGLFWVEVLLTALFGGYWLYRLSQCLGMYDTLLIIPLMQVSWRTTCSGTRWGRGGGRTGPCWLGSFRACSLLVEFGEEAILGRHVLHLRWRMAPDRHGTSAEPLSHPARSSSPIRLRRPPSLSSAQLLLAFSITSSWRCPRDLLVTVG